MEYCKKKDMFNIIDKFNDFQKDLEFDENIDE